LQKLTGKAGALTDASVCSDKIWQFGWQALNTRSFDDCSEKGIIISLKLKLSAIIITYQLAENIRYQSHIDTISPSLKAPASKGQPKLPSGLFVTPTISIQSGKVAAIPIYLHLAMKEV
jgi:hypothetical protein